MKQRTEAKITVLGGGPAGLYCALLIKKANPSHDVTVLERNPADVTYGWGVVFSDRTLASFQQADYKTYRQISDDFVIWDTIDVRYHGETVRCGGHVIASISRKRLLNILQSRCEELGVKLLFECEVHDLSELPPSDLVIAADGVHSLARKTHEDHFKPKIEYGRARYVWYGADKALDCFTFIFHENEHGLFQVHSYPFTGTASTFIIECAESVWEKAGLDRAGEDESLAYCEYLLKDDLRGAHLLSNNSKWINFPTLTTQTWVWRGQSPKPRTKDEGRKNQSGIQNRVVLLGDAAHTAHFSIGSGTKLAMEDAVALANALEQHGDIDTALAQYELERRPVVETFQRAAHESQTYFESVKRYLGMEAWQFAFQLLTRSGRITYDDLHFRDPHFGDAVDRRFWASGSNDQASVAADGEGLPLVAPPPMFAPIKLRSLVLPNRVVLPGSSPCLVQPTTQNSALILTEICAVSPEGRITPDDTDLYEEDHLGRWRHFVQSVHANSGLKVAVQLGHAGRRGSTRPRSEGLDRPLREGNWPLIAASPVPYTLRNQIPREMDRADMDRVVAGFVRATRIAHEAGFDLLQLHFARGYLLAGFLSPLANRRTDEYGGSLENRMRYPLEVFDAVRAEWPQEKPMSVAINVTDSVKGGFGIGEAVTFSSLLKERGCDMVEALAGYTVPGADMPYGRGFLTPLSDLIRNEAGIPTMVGGYLTTSNDVNTILAAGKADLCIMSVDARREAG